MLSALGTLCGVLCVVTSGPPRFVAGALLAVYLPGRAIRVASRWQAPGLAVAAAVDVGLSTCLVVLAGLAFGKTARGIELDTMLPVVVAVSVLAPLTALLGGVKPAPASASQSPGRLLRTVTVPAVVFLALALGSVVIAIRSADSAVQRVETTQLSVLPESHSRAVVTVTNYEHAPTRYRLVVAAPKTKRRTILLKLSAGRTYSTTVSTSGIPAGDRLTVLLYLNHRTHLFRWVWLSIPSPRTGLSATP